MSKEYVDNKMDEAYEMIEQGGYLQAVDKIRQLKIKCPSDILKDIIEWEEKKDNQYTNKTNEIEATNMHIFDKETKKLSTAKDYAWDYYKHYNKIIREYDVH